MGAADIIPGVSGGTIAFITGIYATLLQSIQAVNTRSLSKLLQGKFTEFWSAVNGTFLLSLLAGIAFSFITLSGMIVYLLEHHTMLLFSFFFGLIAASALLVARQIHSHSPVVWLTGVAGCAIAIVITSMSPVETPDTWWFIFLAGAIAISAMILPGISGSFILLLMGKYASILHAIKELDLYVATFFLAGCVTGLAGFSRILSALLKKFHDGTIMLLAGFMIGSLTKVWPWKIPAEASLAAESGKKAAMFSHNVMPDTFQAVTATDPLLTEATLLAISGMAVVFLIELVVSKKQQHPLTEQ
ncbi:DUF368 domain-containing protein [Prosthecochloris vibrioformis]|uniref:DUF368 domain-containing protein n=2 Tax=Chlorobiaceae TaxID=191412 RepID=A0A5C4RZA8_PROVB|nr:DUF368 domain-containing protein [Prosthecochloris vibrioformis]